MNYRNKWLGGVCVAVACAAAGGVVAAGGADASGGGPFEEPEALGANAAPVRSVEPAQADEIHQLERPRTGDDEMPPGFQAAIDDGQDEHWGANPDLARRTAPGTWIVPGDDYVCLARTTAAEGALSFGCASNENVERGLLAPSELDATGAGFLTGVVPDGVDRVTVVDQDGASREVAVERNTYRVPIGPDIAEVRFTDAAGGRHTLPMAWRP